MQTLRGVADEIYRVLNKNEQLNDDIAYLANRTPTEREEDLMGVIVYLVEGIHSAKNSYLRNGFLGTEGEQLHEIQCALVKLLLNESSAFCWYRHVTGVDEAPHSKDYLHKLIKASKTSK